MNMKATILSEAITEAFFAYEWKQLANGFRRYYAVEVLQKRLRNYITRNCSYIDDTAFGISYYNNYKIAHTSPVDYQYQLFKLNDDDFILLSIRFLGTDITKPFVEIVHRTFPMTIATMTKLAPLIKAKYHAFSPKNIRFLDGGNVLANIKAPFYHDLHYVVGNMENLRTLPYPDNYASIRLQRPSTGNNFYPYYDRTYEALVSETPIYKELVAKEQAEDLQALADKGYLFLAYIDGEQAGLVAVDICSEYCLQGFCVFEEILSEKYRGKGYGKALQRHLIEALAIHETRHLYGTIDDRNTPSLKTALGVGREKIAAYVFYPL